MYNVQCSYKTVKRTVKISKIIPLKADIAFKRFPIKFRLHFLTSSFSKEKKKAQIFDWLNLVIGPLNYIL